MKSAHSTIPTGKRLIWVGSIVAIGIILIVFIVWFGNRSSNNLSRGKFDANQAMRDVEYQLSLGPRTVGSQAHDLVVPWMENEFNKAGWKVEEQKATSLGHPILNLVAKRGIGSPWIILGAHYDSRLVADHDPDPAKRTEPVPGGNDGASGVSVLLELARILPDDFSGQVWLLMIDNEDNGEIRGWDWLLGSQAFADQLQSKPDAVVILDMIGDADLNIYKERNSDKTLVDQIWSQAADLGYAKEFLPEEKYAMIDDHMPFVRKGIPAVDVIDFDYPYFHTTQDTSDKVSVHSLQVVGDTMLAWLKGRLSIQ